MKSKPMKYTTEITVEVSREEFIKKFDDPENLKHWQKGFLAHTLLFGSPGQEGCQMELRYNLGARSIILIETIIKRKLPYEFHATYDTKGVHNIQKNYFSELNGNRTKWVSETEFQFSGFFVRAMAFLRPGMFKKQTLRYMQDFKSFAETGKSVS